MLKPRIITSYDNADWENGMTKVGPLWLIWLRCRCYCFFFSWFYEFFRRYCCCFAAHKYVHHEYCHFMFLYFSFHLFFSEKAKKNTYKYQQELQEHQEQENKNCYCHSSCRLFNLDDFFFRRKAVEIWTIAQNQRQIFQMDSTASVLTEYSHLFCRI